MIFKKYCLFFIALVVLFVYALIVSTGQEDVSIEFLSSPSSKELVRGQAYEVAVSFMIRDYEGELVVETGQAYYGHRIPLVQSMALYASSFRGACRDTETVGVKIKVEKDFEAFFVILRDRAEKPGTYRVPVFIWDGCSADELQAKKLAEQYFTVTVHEFKPPDIQVSEEFMRNHTHLNYYTCYYCDGFETKSFLDAAYGVMACPKGSSLEKISCSRPRNAVCDNSADSEPCEPKIIEDFAFRPCKGEECGEDTPEPIRLTPEQVQAWKQLAKNNKSNVHWGILPIVLVLLLGFIILTYKYRHSRKKQ